MQAFICQILSKNQWMKLSILGLIYYTLTQGFQFFTLKYLDTVSFSLILNFTSPIVAILGIVILREKLSKTQIAGVIIFLFGTVFYFSNSGKVNPSILGLVLAFFNASC